MSEKEELAKVYNGGSSSALLIIDMLSDFDFEDGDILFENARCIAKNIATLNSQARLLQIPVIYVNDTFGKWNEDFGTNISDLGLGSEKARTIVELLSPSAEDHFILKPHRSGFYATGLGVLLMSLNVTNVIVTGITTDICVLFTAHDAYMRGFNVLVPNDCCAAVERNFHDQSLEFLRRVAEADTSESTAMQLFPQTVGEDSSARKSRSRESADLSHGFRLNTGQSRTDNIQSLEFC